MYSPTRLFNNPPPLNTPSPSCSPPHPPPKGKRMVYKVYAQYQNATSVLLLYTSASSPPPGDTTVPRYPALCMMKSEGLKNDSIQNLGESYKKHVNQVRFNRQSKICNFYWGGGKFIITSPPPIYTPEYSMSTYRIFQSICWVDKEKKAFCNLVFSSYYSYLKTNPYGSLPHGFSKILSQTTILPT